MKLTSTQVVGLGAIVIFGGILVGTLMKGPRDPDMLPSGVRLSDLPPLPEMKVEIPAPDPSGLGTALTPPASAPGSGAAAASSPDATLSYPGQPDYLNVGSQAAKDDLYCAGVISAEFDALPEQHPEEMSKQIAAQIALDYAGAAKLIADGVATQDNSAGFTLAYGAKARADRAAGALRIPFATCMARAAALPKAN